MPGLLKKESVLPGFGITLGFTVLYLALIVLIPLAALLLKTATSNWADFWAAISAPRVVAAYRLTFGASFAAAAINSVFGLLVAWVLVRYKFPFSRLVDGLVDLPFALPTAVAGIALTSLYSPNGFLGKFASNYGIKIAYTELGVLVALTFVGLPFAVRTVQPVLKDIDIELEEAALSMGASRFQTFVSIILPLLWPSVLTGFSLAFARALGEYGSVVFISGNMPMKTEIVSLLIMTKLDQFDYLGASAIAVVMLLASFCIMLLINTLQFWASKRSGS